MYSKVRLCVLEGTDYGSIMSTRRFRFWFEFMYSKVRFWELEGTKYGSIMIRLMYTRSVHELSWVRVYEFMYTRMRTRTEYSNLLMYTNPFVYSGVLWCIRSVYGFECSSGLGRTKTQFRLLMNWLWLFWWKTETPKHYFEEKTQDLRRFYSVL
jgi:hypothetical protein